MFRLGLFEDPYVDEESADAAFGRAEHVAVGLDLQRRSMVLLQNSGVLPLAAGSTVYVENTSLIRLSFDALSGLEVNARSSNSSCGLKP